MLPPRVVSWASCIDIAAVIANLVPYFLFGWGEERVDPAVAGTLNATTPLFTVVLAVATGTEASLSRRRAGGLLVGFLGALRIIGPWRDFGGTATGALACLVAAFSYAISYVYMRRYLTGRGTSPIVLAASQLTAGALMLILTAPLLARQATRIEIGRTRSRAMTPHRQFAVMIRSTRSLCRRTRRSARSRSVRRVSWSSWGGSVARRPRPSTCPVA